MDQLTEAVIYKAAEEAANRATESVLIKLGLNPGEPIEAQKDMASLREVRLLMTDPEFQRDMVHLRNWRKAMEAVQKKGMLTATAMIATALVVAMGMGVKELIGK